MKNIDRPLPLITFDNKKGVWHLGSEAKNMLSKLESPIGIIAVAGLYRTGKSYILNRLLDRQVSKNKILFFHESLFFVFKYRVDLILVQPSMLVQRGFIFGQNHSKFKEKEKNQ